MDVCWSLEGEMGCARVVNGGVERTVIIPKNRITAENGNTHLERYSIEKNM